MIRCAGGAADVEGRAGYQRLCEAACWSGRGFRLRYWLAGTAVSPGDLPGDSCRNPGGAGYPRIRRRYAVTDEDVEELVALLEREALVVPGEAEVERAVPEDPADERVLACAVEAEADAIVSGDQHLLGLRAYRGIPILTVREFLEWLESGGQ